MEQNNKRELNATQLRQKGEKRAVVEQLKKTPIIQLACERAGISRATFYRWQEKDKKFNKEVRDAMTEGEMFINELSESQIIALIKDKNFQAIQLWLKNHHPKYTDKIEISGNINNIEEKLAPEQAAVVRAALKLARFNKKND